MWGKKCVWISRCGARFVQNLPLLWHFFRKMCLSWGTFFVKCSLCNLMGQVWPGGRAMAPFAPPLYPPLCAYLRQPTFYTFFLQTFFLFLIFTCQYDLVRHYSERWLEAGTMIWGPHYVEQRSLMAWVGVKPKEGWARVAAPILILVWHRLFRLFFFNLFFYFLPVNMILCYTIWSDGQKETPWVESRVV